MTALKLIINPKPTQADLNRAWREAGWVFLDACFAHAGKPQLDRLAREFSSAREAMVENWQVCSVAPSRLAIESENASQRKLFPLSKLSTVRGIR